MTTAKKQRRKRCQACGALKEGVATVDGQKLCPDCVAEVGEGIAAEAERLPAPAQRKEDTLDALAVEHGLIRASDVESEKIAEKFNGVRASGQAARAVGAGGGDGASPLPAPSTQVTLELPEDRERWRDLPRQPVPGWPLPSGRLSASAFGAFTRCPEQFRQMYLLQRYGPSSGSSIAGNAAHAAIEAVYQHKMAYGQDAEPSDVAPVAAAAFERQVKKERNGIDWGGAPGEWKDKAVVIAQTYAEHVAPTQHPVETEALFVIRVAGCPVPVTGFIDLVTDHSLVDYKIGRSAQHQVAPDWRIQGLIYLLSRQLPMTWHSLGWPLKSGEVKYHTPSDSPGLVLPLTAGNHLLAADLVRNVTRGIMAMYREFGRDEPWPNALTHTWACNVCSYREDGCRWWQSESPDLTGGLL
jgi:hypothetical protein